MSGMEANRSVRGYRAATESLAEQPSAATRNAILAAAARQVQAGPRDAREPLAPARRRQRWPYAAAAAVLLSTLAVMMATRTEQEMPTFTAPSGNAERAAVPTAEPVPAKPATAEIAVADAAPTPAPAASKPAPKIAQRESRPTQMAMTPATPPPAPAIAIGEAKLNAPPEAARAKEEVAGLRAAPAEQAASAEAPRAAADAALAPLAKRQSAPLNESAERRRDEGESAAGRSAPGAAQGAIAGDLHSEADLSANEWLERIVKLRRAGRHGEADAELKRFRERFPQVTIPPDAQAPAGTR